MLIVKTFLLSVALFVLSACVTGQSDVDRMQMQIRILERQQHQDRQKMQQELEKYQEELAAATRAMEERISEAGSPVQASQANLWAELESLRVQVATMSGNLDALERKVSRMGEDQDIPEEVKALQQRTEKLDRNLQTMASQLGLDLQDEMEAAAIADDPGLESIEDPQTARALYQRALDSFYDREYERAQSLWEEFADNFPDHALISNAYFWQGESFYQMQEYAEAALAYQEVITNYPDSNKITASMLKQGMSFIKLGRKEAGRMVLNELLEEYPDSAEARRARAFISEEDL
ncbi:tol-pal system protein YbgF [Desulfonatronospira sp.]|uniref:tol-pal system protein YbgF n=1 Tax=Desulfonatronospira sp. TaxID=1962951 RepID=UPI0025C318E3|nr:tol-pal system protein YbgF [Desulfonatronospira sp.]